MKRCSMFWKMLQRLNTWEDINKTEKIIKITLKSENAYYNSPQNLLNLLSGIENRKDWNTL